MSKTTHTSGKRKRAIARATIAEGKGIVRVNHQLLETYEPRMARMRIMEPLLIGVEVAKKVDIDVDVVGGGQQGQADAVRLAISKGLIQFSKNKQLRQEFLDYDR